MTATSTRRRTNYRPTGYARMRLPGGRSLLLHRRTLVISLVLLALALLIATGTVVTGTYDITPVDAFGVLGGGGSGLDRFIVVGQRLPRVIAALLVGAALATSGAIFQSVSRNPLGSPDVIGFTTGAATGGIAVILLAGTATAAAVSIGTFVGGGIAAVAVVLLSMRRRLTGERLVLDGIAVAAMLAAVNDYLLSRAPIEQAETAKAWQYGSLNAITWGPIAPVAVVVALVVPAALAHGRALRALELGDDAAAGIGLPLQRTRIIALALGVALAAIAVATAGPIGFLALAAPQLARRIARTPGVSILAAASMGALLLVTADLGAQRLLAPFQIPVGLVTAALGGAYLVWVLVTADASHRAARTSQ